MTDPDVDPLLAAHAHHPIATAAEPDVEPTAREQKVLLSHGLFGRVIGSERPQEVQGGSGQRPVAIFRLDDGGTVDAEGHPPVSTLILRVVCSALNPAEIVRNQ